MQRVRTSMQPEEARRSQGLAATPRAVKPGRLGMGVLGLCAVFALWPVSASATRFDPCSTNVGPSSTRGPIPADSGFLILQLSRNDLQGSQIFAGRQTTGRLPTRTGQCAWIPLPAGEHSIRIVGLQDEISVRIAAKRTTFFRLDENPASTVRYPLRFAVRLSGQAADFPAELRQGLLPLAAHADPQLSDFDLADDESLAEPQPDSAIPSALSAVAPTCNPKAFAEGAELHYLLVLSRDNTGYRVRAYNTAYGSGEAAADLNEVSERAGNCQGKTGASALQCLLRQALKQARDRGHYCLQIATQPADAQVQLTALAGPSFPAGRPQTLPQRGMAPRERVLFAGPDDPTGFRLLVEHPRFLPQERLIDFRETMLQSVTISLQPRPVAAVPLYKKWWLWQSLATAVVIGVTGTVAGIYTNDRGSR